MKNTFKTNFNFIFNIIVIMSLLTVGFTWADTNGVWSNAEDILPGTFGEDEEVGDYEFPRDLTVQGDLNTKNNLNIEGRMNATDEFCVDGECYGTWGEVCNNWVQTNSVN